MIIRIFSIILKDQLLEVLGVLERRSPAVLTDKVASTPLVRHSDEVVIPLILEKEVVISFYLFKNYYGAI